MSFVVGVGGIRQAPGLQALYFQINVFFGSGGFRMG